MTRISDEEVLRLIVLMGRAISSDVFRFADSKALDVRARLRDILAGRLRVMPDRRTAAVVIRHQGSTYTACLDHMGNLQEQYFDGIPDADEDDAPAVRTPREQDAGLTDCERNRETVMGSGT